MRQFAHSEFIVGRGRVLQFHHEAKEVKVQRCLVPTAINSFMKVQGKVFQRWSLGLLWLKIGWLVLSDRLAAVFHAAQAIKTVTKAFLYV